MPTAVPGAARPARSWSAAATSDYAALRGGCREELHGWPGPGTASSTWSAFELEEIETVGTERGRAASWSASAIVCATWEDLRGAAAAGAEAIIAGGRRSASGRFSPRRRRSSEWRRRWIPRCGELAQRLAGAALRGRRTSGGELRGYLLFGGIARRPPGATRRRSRTDWPCSLVWSASTAARRGRPSATPSAAGRARG